VSLGDDVVAELAHFRTEAESQMRHEGIITRAAESQTLDPVTGEYITARTTVYTGPGKVGYRSAVTTQVDAAGQLLTVQQLTLSLPVLTSAGVRVGDVWETLTSPLDPARVGARLRVAGDFDPTFSTARRLPVKVVTSDG